MIAVQHFLLKAVEAHRRGDPLPHVTTDPEQSMTHIDTLAEFIPSGERFPHLTNTAPAPTQV